MADPAVDGVRDRFGAFYAFYVGLFALLFAYLITVWLIEATLAAEFQGRVDRAVSQLTPGRPLEAQLAERIHAAVDASAWVRLGGLDVTTLVLAQDGETWLYVGGYGRDALTPSLPGTGASSGWMDLLPASARVSVTLPHNALASNLVLILYSTILIVVVYVANHRVTGRERERLGLALSDRNASAQRAAEIEAELGATRARLSSIEPLQQEHGEEIEALERERAELHDRLAALAAREESLRADAENAVGLAQEVRALEDLLEEATTDLESKDGEIDRLEQNLKRATRASGRGRTREAERLARRFRTLYKTIEIDDRALDGLADLGDEALRLKAEEAIKRLADEAENVAVRRKVGGLPDRVQVFELGFAGKGRIYYGKGRARRFRILLVGAKNTQPADLETLRRLQLDD
ncbi:MAG: hypothetical protein AAGC67_13425 [Myxococcota bacterium]